MKILLGVVFLLMAVAAFAYVGLYLCLYGGIVDVIRGWQSNPVDSNVVAWGIIRAVFFETIGGLAALVPAIIGIGLIGWKIAARARMHF